MTHLVEIDLLRAGERWTLLTPAPSAPYCIFVSRANRRPRVEVWPIKLQDPLPLIPIPLVEPDPDVPLDLGRAIQTIYDTAAYDLRIDYTQPPPKSDLSPEDAAWVEERLRAAGLR